MAVPVFAVLLFGTAACVDCPDTEYRSAESGASIPVPNTLRTVVVSVTTNQSRSPSSQRVYLSLGSVDLRWHVRGIRLLEAEGQLRLLFDLPVGLPPGDAAGAASVEIRETDPAIGTFDRFFELMMDNGVAVEITTDLPGMELILVPLRLKHGSAWQESSCAYT
jgi:hypothetical protein